MQKTILGLDLRIDSIGWALLEKDDEKNRGRILATGTRILPMSDDVRERFASGQSVSLTAERTIFRNIRRQRERHLLRRERLLRVLNILNFLPEHYASHVDFWEKPGKFLDHTEPKIAYRLNQATKKTEFVFEKTYREMLADFEKHQPSLVHGGKKIPYDWTIYYIRKKALTQRIDKHELAWLLLNFNQKRGYFQPRGEEEDTTNKRLELYSLRVLNVEATDEKRGEERWYNVHLENGWVYRRASKSPLDWTGEVKELIVTTELNDDGSIKLSKQGKERRSFRAPTEDDWTLLKKKTEIDIESSGKTVGAFIYDVLLQKPSQKIRGGLIRVIERKFYKKELELILTRQSKFHPELKNQKLYGRCVAELYRHNDGHKRNILAKGFTHLFVNDIIFYQRPIKTKPSTKGSCPLENRKFLRDGHLQHVPLNCIARSHPLFQEFRLWHFIHKLEVFRKAKHPESQLKTDVNVTSQFFTTAGDKAELFDWLSNKKEIGQQEFFDFPKFPSKQNIGDYRWNYAQDKPYPCNETRALILSRLENVSGIPVGFLDTETENDLWHILYSVEDKNDLEKALNTFAVKKGLTEESQNSFVTQFKNSPPFKKEYGPYSLKAIKKLLPLMRSGKHWKLDTIHEETKTRIHKLLTSEFNIEVLAHVRRKQISLISINHFKGLPLWLASYIAYDIHSEQANATRWKTPKEIETLKQHKLHNPVAEQVINETLRVIRDIWNHYGKGRENFFQEIHTVLAGDLKNRSRKRKKMYEKAAQSEATNLRLKLLLQELSSDSEFENVRSRSPRHLHLLRVYEEGALLLAHDQPAYISKISNQAQPSPGDLIEYKLWLQDKYRSPYTGRVVPLNKLFTPAYALDHLLPLSRNFDDSLSNQVITEVEVKRAKSSSSAFEYIKNNSGKKLDLDNGRKASVFTVEEYQDFVNTNYTADRSKTRKLLTVGSSRGPGQFPQTETSHISRLMKALLSNIVREENEPGSYSRNVLTPGPSIIRTLRQHWGLNDVWNLLLMPRFERLNTLTDSNGFGEWTNKKDEKVFRPWVPLNSQKRFNKSNLDHRFHALNAIVIACASRHHMDYLDNSTAVAPRSTEQKEQLDLQLQEKLCFRRYNDHTRQYYGWAFRKPWHNFTHEALARLESVVVSFKQNIRVVNKTTNYYSHWEKQASGEYLRVVSRQTKGETWSIRKPMHKDTVAGLVNLKFKKHVSLPVALVNWQMIVNKSLKSAIGTLVKQGFDTKMIEEHLKKNTSRFGKDLSKIEVYHFDVDSTGKPKNVAYRRTVDESFNTSKIEATTDTGIQKIMVNHLETYKETGNDNSIGLPSHAFSPAGVNAMNTNVRDLNSGKPHNPIYKVRIYESIGNKFPLGESGNKKLQYVETAKDTNLFFAIYADELGKRTYKTPPLNMVIHRLEKGLAPVAENNESGDKLLFYLSPNDLVYVPGKDEAEVEANFILNGPTNQLDRIYKIVSFTGARLYAIPQTVARPIVDKSEFGQLNKLEFSLDRQLIKNTCIKLEFDRLGNPGPIHSGN